MILATNETLLSESPSIMHSVPSPRMPLKESQRAQILDVLESDSLRNLRRRGGNFEEPVTQSTLGTVKTFLGLSYDRAYKRFYPAIDPLMWWSRYLDQLAPWLNENLDPNWTRDVKRLHELLRQGESINQMMQVTGEEGITLEDFVIWQKSVLLDMAYLQQDAFDEVDTCMSRDRQLESLRLIMTLIDREYPFKDRDEAREFFTRVIGLYKNWIIWMTTTVIFYLILSWFQVSRKRFESAEGRPRKVKD